MRFQPVFLPEDRGLDGRASQTFLRHYNQCPRSAYLYQTHKGGTQTAHMARGSALHAVLERATRLCLDPEKPEPTIPPDVVKAIADEVLAEYPVPIEEHDYVREMSYRWASEAGFDPGAVVAVEQLFVLDLAGFQVRCKIDFAQLLEDGEAVTVTDYKSSRAAPAYEEIARRVDGRLVPKQFQLLLYAMAVAYGIPVREEQCDWCTGKGYTVSAGPGGTERVPCEKCRERGVLEVREPFPVASRAQRFDLEYVFPGIEDREGRMLRRSTTLTRLELDEYRASFDGLLARVKGSEESGDWPAVVSDAACSECPAPSACPIPSELRDHRGEINSIGQAAEAAEVLDRIQAEHAAVRKEIKAFCKAHDLSLPYGGKVWEWVPSTTVRVDRDGLIGAARRAAEYGEPFDENDYIKVSTGTLFKARDLTAEELSEGSNGR